MASGPEHYREAERLVSGLKNERGLVYIEDGNEQVVAVAQVHATLALAAAAEGLPHGKVLVDQCNVAESAYGRQCINAAGHSTGHDFGDGVGEDDEDRGSIEDVYSASELAEMDRDTEYRLDAEDEARHAEQGGA